MKYLIIVLVSVISFISCTDNTEVAKQDSPENIPYEVKYYGALKNMMHKGDISSKFNLEDLKDKKHIYAIGAIENLKGEIQIYDGESFNSYVSDSIIEFDKSFAKKATLLVYAQVEKWSEYSIPEKVKTYEQLEDYISKTAEKNGVDIKKPFPFQVKGNAQSFDWHVINWKDGDTEHSHEKHVNSGLHGNIENSEVDLLGFYSDSHHTIFTHHSTNMHIHFKTADESLAGHIDGIILGQGMKLYLPTITD